MGIMASIFASIDDKHVPLYRILWVSDIPHFCGQEECTVEGRYEIRLESEESVFATREQRDVTLATYGTVAIGRPGAAISRDTAVVHSDHSRCGETSS